MIDRVANLTLGNTCGTTVWAGFTDQKQEGMFIDSDSNNLTLPGGLWRRGEPNGGDIENCVALNLKKMEFLDISCEATLCGFCSFEAIHKLTLRGIIHKLNIDREYFWTRHII